jgi:nitrogen fixation/metabolism regulation signal transduction histidine kinase
MAGPEMPYEYLVRELLTNAVGAVAGRDQTGRDQTGRDQTGMVWLSVRMTDDATAELTVSDNGPGFPGDFRAAFQARKPVHRPDRPGRGTGFHKLRLYAEARGARFELGDRPEGGAVVTVCLPLTTGPDWQETA